MTPPRGALYDTIGKTYARYRRPDPRIMRAIEDALGGARSVVSVGAGTGSYEPHERRVAAVEPSRVMIAQRTRAAAPVAQSVAEHLPFADGAFDAALAVLTVHHWPDASAGLAEMRRVAARQVVLTWDPAVDDQFWMRSEYVPAINEREASMTTLDPICAALDVIDVRAVPVPWDCTDGFFGAYWRRPEMYLDAEVRAAISALALLDQPYVDRAMAQLGRDLADGAWHARHADLLSLDELDLGYRLVIAGT
jgi:SAM-dependent methyltransferase